MKNESISIETMLDHPRPDQDDNKIRSIDPPEDSPTATLSFFSDCDMNEDEDQSVEQENLVSHVPQNELIVSWHDSIDISSSELDQSMIGIKHEMKKWKRERQELLKLRAVVRRQEQQQQELQAKLEAHRRRQLMGANRTASRDPNGHHVHSLSDNIDEIIQRNLNCYPEDEIACQLEEVLLTLKASQKQVHNLQAELIESQRNHERTTKENLSTKENIQDQLSAAQEQLETERRKREDAMDVHKLQVELQQMRAKEDQEELNLKIDFWKEKCEMLQEKFSGEGSPVRKVKEEHKEHGRSTTGTEVNHLRHMEELPYQCLETVPEEQPRQENGDFIEEGIDDLVVGDEYKEPKHEDESQRSDKSDDKNGTIDSLQRELSEIKKKYQESKYHLTNLESVIHEMSGNQHSMVEKIQCVVQLLQKTQEENEKLKKEKATVWQKTKRENEKLKKEKLALEKQRKGKLTMMTRNAKR